MLRKNVVGMAVEEEGWFVCNKNSSFRYTSHFVTIRTKRSRRLTDGASKTRGGGAAKGKEMKEEGQNRRWSARRGWGGRGEGGAKQASEERRTEMSIWRDTTYIITVY